MKAFLRENPTIAFGLGLPLLLVVACRHVGHDRSSRREQGWSARKWSIPI